MKNFTNQRLFDLVRFCRMELHAANLITDEEYVMLASDTASVQRLEDYDVLRAQHFSRHIQDLKKNHVR